MRFVGDSKKSGMKPVASGSNPVVDVNDTRRIELAIPVSAVVTINVDDVLPVFVMVPVNAIFVPFSNIPGFPLTPVVTNAGLPVLVALLALPLLFTHVVTMDPFAGFVPVPITSVASSHSCSAL